MQKAITATYMRGGTSKGVFFRAEDLPPPGPSRDRLLMRVIGSPDPYGQQIDGMGAATSSTSKVVIVSPSHRPDCDVDYLFGQVSIRTPGIDWSGNCGNLTAAVGPFAIACGIVRAPADGSVAVRIWQANVGKRIVAHVPMASGAVVETGDFVLDGIAFPAAEIRLEFLEPGGAGEGLVLPTGAPADWLDVPGFGPIEATLINAGNPTVIVSAASLGLSGTESRADVNGDAALLGRLERIRAHAAVRMGLASSEEQASAERPATPKIAFVAPRRAYVASDGRTVDPDAIDLCVRIVSMGQLHHAVTGTGAIALAVAAVLPDTVVRKAIDTGWADTTALRLGHASGVLSVQAEATQSAGVWHIAKAMVGRSARRLMVGQVFVPTDSL